MPRVVVRKGYRCLPGKRRELLAALQRVDAVAAEAGWPRGRYLFIETKAPGEPDVEVEFTFESYSEMEQRERRLREHLGRSPRDAATMGSAGQEFLIEPSSTRYLLLLDDGAGAAPARRVAEGQPAGTPPTAASMAPPARPPQSPAPLPAAAPPPVPSQPAIQRRQGATGYGPAGRSPAGGGGFTGTGAAEAGPARLRPAATAGGSGGVAPRGRAAEPPPPEPAEMDEDEDFFEEPESEPEAQLSPAERRLRQLAEARAALDKAESTVNVSAEQRTRAREITQAPPNRPAPRAGASG